jgi:hypothetical protein
VKPIRLFWVEGRFSWWFVAAVSLGTLALLAFDYYWRTHDTEFSRFW